MIATCLATCLAGLVSAFLPVTPIEPYLVAVAAATGYSPVALGIAAAAGQTAGKVVFFLGACGALRSTRIRRWVGAVTRRSHGRRSDQAPRGGRVKALLEPIGAAAKRLMALLDRPAFAVPILLLSATTGMPPLLATSIYAAHTRINTPVFALVCLLGRSIRFVAIAFAPQLVMGLSTTATRVSAPDEGAAGSQTSRRKQKRPCDQGLSFCARGGT